MSYRSALAAIAAVCMLCLAWHYSARGAHAAPAARIGSASPVNGDGVRHATRRTTQRAASAGPLSSLGARTLPTRTTDVILLFGQSNMQGHGAGGVSRPLGPARMHCSLSSLPTPNRSVHCSGPANWTRSNAHLTFAVHGGEYGPEVGVAKACNASHRPVVLIKIARDGTPIRDFLDGDLRQRIVDGIHRAKALYGSHSIAGLLWMQGESDALEAGAAPYYGSNFSKWIHFVRALTSDNLPIVAGLVRDAGHWPNAAEVNAAITAVAANTTHCALVNTTDLPVLDDDPGHLNGSGVIQLGERMIGALGAMTGVCQENPNATSIQRIATMGKRFDSNAATTTAVLPGNGALRHAGGS